jgi:hypothetical protein
MLFIKNNCFLVVQVVGQTVYNAGRKYISIMYISGP